MMLEDEHPKLEGVQYATGDEKRIISNRSRKNETVGLKFIQCSVVNVSGDESKI